MTEVPSPTLLLGQLLFDPGMVTRFPVPAKRASFFRVMCSCGETPTFGGKRPDSKGHNLKTVVCTHKLYSTEEFSGHVWIGRCADCGRLFYAAQRDKGILPRRPLEIKRHKIITRAR